MKIFMFLVIVFSLFSCKGNVKNDSDIRKSLQEENPVQTLEKDEELLKEPQLIELEKINILNIPRNYYCYYTHDYINSLSQLNNNKNLIRLDIDFRKQELDYFEDLNESYIVCSNLQAYDDNLITSAHISQKIIDNKDANILKVIMVNELPRGDAPTNYINTIETNTNNGNIFNILLDSGITDCYIVNSKISGGNDISKISISSDYLILDKNYLVKYPGVKGEFGGKYMVCSDRNLLVPQTSGRVWLSEQIPMTSPNSIAKINMRISPILIDNTN